MIIGDRARFEKLEEEHPDLYLYEVPADKMERKPSEESIDKEEYFYRKPMRPSGEKLHYSSALKAMLENGVRVFFVAPDKFEELKKLKEVLNKRFVDGDKSAEDDGEKMLAELQEERL